MRLAKLETLAAAAGCSIEINNMPEGGGSRAIYEVLVRANDGLRFDEGLHELVISREYWPGDRRWKAEARADAAFDLAAHETEPCTAAECDWCHPEADQDPVAS